MTHFEFGSTSASPAIGRARTTQGVIWIAGFSAAGKTTVGRTVERLLRERSIDAIFLDGDDLRRVFSRRWGYERDDRIELAQVYFRLSNYLASQGYTVVLAAIAMYEDVREWLRENLPEVYEVYLDVPEAERVRRDRHTKRVYPTLKATNAAYEIPTEPDLSIPNFGGISPRSAAELIVDSYLATREPGQGQIDRADHWQKFYSEGFSERRPSTFAQAAASHLGVGDRLLEIGCGNGRDALLFAKLGHDVVAIDPSDAAINAARAQPGSERIRFLRGKFPDVSPEVDGPFDTVYSRFSLHAMTQVEQDEALRAGSELLRPGGRLLLECRSINDPLARKGEVISPTERIHGHYRRFIVLDRLVAQLEGLGFAIDSSIESNGLAVYNDDDPVVIRVIASKPP